MSTRFRMMYSPLSRNPNKPRHQSRWHSHSSQPKLKRRPPSLPIVRERLCLNSGSEETFRYPRHAPFLDGGRPWRATRENDEWACLRQRGMNTAFRFPLREKMNVEQRDRLAFVLRELPVTSLVFLKHIGRVEVDIRRSNESRSFAWSVHRQRAGGSGWKDVSGFAGSGDYRVTLESDDGAIETFFLAYDADITIGDHRGGLDEFSWEGVEYTEISVAARMRDKEPVSINNEWKRIHVFLPTGEPSPYDLLVSGAFGSNLSRQEIRVEDESTNYNRFMFRQAARILCERLFPNLIGDGATVTSCLRLLDRHVEPHSRCTTAAAQALYEEVVHALADLPFTPGSGRRPSGDT